MAPAVIPPVNTLVDDPNGPIKGMTTLRDAIGEANVAQGASTISFQNGLTGTIQLDAALPTLNSNITIAGPGPGTQIGVAGMGNQNPFRIFSIGVGRTCEIDNLSITNGWVNNDQGGGILNSGNLTLSGDMIRNNFAVGATASGGGIYNGTGATLNLKNTNIVENTAGASGGGIMNFGSLTASNIQLYANSAQNGGGLYNVGSNSRATISNGTQIYQNTAYKNGGGIYVASGIVSMASGMVSYNGAGGQGGGIYNFTGSLTLQTGVNVQANRAGNGGGMYLGQNSTTTLDDVTIQQNTVTGKGVGIYEQTGATLDEIAVNDPDDPNGPFIGP